MFVRNVLAVFALILAAIANPIEKREDECGDTAYLSCCYSIDNNALGWDCEQIPGKFLPISPFRDILRS